jgi:2-polyprenyl-6-methoxyphenol hydroxylase-like FAD-dependent oxidoreductase
VVVRFTDGTEEGGNLLIGADGAHSVVRNFLFQCSPQHVELLDSPVVSSATLAKFDGDVALEVRDLSPLCHVTLDSDGLFTFASSKYLCSP